MRVLDNLTARRIFLARHGLAERPSGPGKLVDLQSVIADLSFVQLDSINTVARAHHMILGARRQSYRDRFLDERHRARGVFEHWTHDASVIDMVHFPHWRHKMARDAELLRGRWKNWRRDGFEEKFDDVLRHISDHGPCCSADVGEDEKRSSRGWWDWHPSKTALEYLWRSGELSVCHRKGFRKYYNLTERVIPPEALNQRPKIEETIDWACNAALERLGFATSGEIANFWDLLTKAETKSWCQAEVAAGRLIRAEVTAADGRRWPTLLRPETLDLVPPTPTGMMRILSPFDPALRDRKRAERLFGFHYRIEIFVPEAKRQYGYYVFPILEGSQLVGRVDMKCERKASTLNVRALWPEKGVLFGAGRQEKLSRALLRTARLAGVENVAFAPDWLRTSQSG